MDDDIPAPATIPANPRPGERYATAEPTAAAVLAAEYIATADLVGDQEDYPPVILSREVARLAAERDRLREAVGLAMADRQCAQKLDGPHEGCPCWYCRCGAAVADIKGEPRS